MVAAFLIMLREGLEAALITGIVATYLTQTGRSAWLPAVWVGVFLAIALSLFVGAGLQVASASFPQKLQELFEAGVGAIAVVVLVWMVFWMRKAARSIKSELHGSIDAALSSESGQGWALTAMVFFAVAREGLESVFFLLAIFQQSTGPAAPAAALAGILAAAAIGYAIYVGGARLNLRFFFRWTGVFILIVAAGLTSSTLANLHEAGLWNGLQERVYDWSGILPESSPLGAVLAGIFNYSEAPAVGQVIAYLGFLAVTLFLFLRPTPAPRPALQTADLRGDANASS
jgi:high-affinity iron transporter